MALQWSDMHPYNATHVIRIGQPPVADRLRRALAQTLERRGLGQLVLDPQRGRFHFDTASSACELQVIPAGADAAAAIDGEIERQLNTPFAPAQPFVPFRCFMVAGKEAFHFGLAYFHPAADAESIAQLMKDVVEAYEAGNAGVAPATRPPDLYPPRHGGYLLRHPWLLPHWAGHLLALGFGLRSSCRPHYRDDQDMRNAFTSFALRGAELAALTRTSKSLGVTFNDLCLAILLQALAPLASGHRQSSARRSLSVGCVVNTRRDLGVDSGSAFGLFLGSFTVTHAVPEGIALEQLAREVQVQTQRIKQSRLYLASPIHFACVRWLFRFFPTERRKRFYQKHHPLWGGITNMNLNNLWAPRPGGPVMEYLRGVSTGPATPLVVAVTTFGDAAHVGLTYRTSAFTPNAIAQVKNTFANAAARADAVPSAR